MQLTINVPDDLNPETANLIVGFAEALALKARRAEEKYGYSNDWKTDEWEADLKRDLLKHVYKGDPRDVALYAAFAWFRGWNTTPA